MTLVLFACPVDDTKVTGQLCNSRQFLTNSDQVSSLSKSWSVSGNGMIMSGLIPILSIGLSGNPVKTSSKLSNHNYPTENRPIQGQISQVHWLQVFYCFLTHARIALRKNNFISIFLKIPQLFLLLPFLFLKSVFLIIQMQHLVLSQDNKT